MRAIGRVTVLLLLIGVVACGVMPSTSPSVTIKADRNPSANLSSYHTWAWAAARARPPAWNPDDRRARLDSLIRAGVSRELAARGIEPAGPSGPDLLIDYDVKVQEKSTDTFSGYFNYRRQGGSGDMGDAFMGYDEGTLIIAAFDARTRAMVWRGTASAVIGDQPIRDEVINDAIHRMFERFS